MLGNIFRTAYPGGAARDRLASTQQLIQQDAMPNIVKFACKRGTACAFDTAVYHTALGNASGVCVFAVLTSLRFLNEQG